MWTQNLIVEKDGLETELSHISRMSKFFSGIQIGGWKKKYNTSIILKNSLPLSNLFTTTASYKLQESQH